VPNLTPVTTELRCKECGAEYPATVRTACERCFGPLEVAYDLDAVKERLTRELLTRRDWDFWRYAELLPVGVPRDGMDLKPGFTPLRRCRNLESRLGLREVFAKDETVNPTYSFKDRPAAIGVLKSIEWGLPAVGCASTGNLANATAAAAAKAGIPCYVFVPANLPGGKILTTLAYGAKVVGIEGSYDDANRVANLVADKFGWGLLNINVRPYYVEGSKSIGFEILEQLGWRAPDAVIIPLGSGALLSAVYKGLTEFESLGFVRDLSTRISGSQPAGCSPIASAYSAGLLEIAPVEKPETIAESLAIGDPASGIEALRIIRKTRGFADAPTDQEIIDGQRLLAKSEGILAEPAGGTVVASLLRKLESGELDRSDSIVLLITGSGLKTVNTFAPGDVEISRVPSTLSAVEKALEVA